VKPKSSLDFHFLLSDLDGTLLTPDHRITERSLAAIQAWRARGGKFSVASSRPPLGMRDAVTQTSLDLPFAAFNGGLILAPNFTELESHTISNDLAVIAMRELRAQGFDVWLYRGLEWWVEKVDGARVRREATAVGFEPRVSRDLDALAQGTHKIVAISLDPDKLPQAEALLRSRWKGQLQVVRSHSAQMDITHPLANKGTALESLARAAGTDPAHTAAIGDMLNDLDMFAVAGFSIAMGNANPAVKQAAQGQTTSNAEDGFAAAIEKYLLD
jgi:Cof subfamily protein (haloacid dehalogenase superfamily)